MNMLKMSASVVILALVAAGCSTSPPTPVKPADMPQAYAAPIAAGSEKEITTEWWKGFSSPELAALVDESRSTNLDIAAAAARVMQAQAQTGVAASALFPSVNLSGNAQRSGSKHGFNAGTFNSFSLSAGASYELDFWGAVRDNLRAAHNNALAAIYARDLVELTTEADVANTYMAVLALRERIAIAQQNIAAAKRILAITEAKVTNGVLSNLELSQQRAQVAAQEAQIPALQQLQRQQLYALAILLGHTPEAFDVKGTSLEGIAIQPVQAGIPSTLLTRRPDIAQAEATLVAAHANLDAARAAFLPSIGLTGNGGYSSATLANLINPSNLAWSIGASVLQSIFDGGRLTSERDIAKGREAELVATYRSTVLNALSDVETQLGAVTALAEQERLTTEEVKNAAEAFRISELQYREGIVDLLTVLQSQQTLFNSQDTLIQIKLARLQAGVGLYRALGGGWSVAADKDIPTRNDFVPVPDLTDLPIGNPF
ncbi:MAG: efflux transporter outer membrane subunit [Alphaproteobacteria bacterium]|nr:efflux transporter outer membrane subunit [Alphaproteobacteria bacterium]